MVKAASQPLKSSLLVLWLAACGSPAREATPALPESSSSRATPAGASSVSPAASGAAEPSATSGETGAAAGVGPGPGAVGSEAPAGTNAPLSGAAEPPATGSSSEVDPSSGTDTGADGAPACPASATAAPGEVTQSVTVGGLTRTFIRHVPSGYTGTTPVPVVLDFHPRGGTGASWRNATSWASVADSAGFILVWPDGIQNSWNVGERCCGPAHDQNIDDIGFTRALLAALERDACIDSKRVYATGCSNGGGMAYDLACRAADIIAAVAPVDFDCTTGPTNDPSCGNCAPARPISATQFRGTNDTVVPYAGGVSAVNSAITFPGAPANFETWGEINQCTGTPQALSGHAACQTYPSCGAGVATTLCTVQNGTHCGSYDSFDIVAVAWEQLSKASLP